MADILAAIAILVAILTTLFSLVYPEMKRIMALTPQTGDMKGNNKANYLDAVVIRNTKVLPLFFFGCILLTLVSSAGMLERNN